MRKIILVDLCNLCKFIQCNIFPERRINITLCPAAFAGFHLMERKNLYRRGSVAGKMDDQDVQQILADLFVIFLRVLCLFQDRTEIEIKPVFHFIGMEQKIFICIVNDKFRPSTPSTIYSSGSSRLDFSVWVIFGLITIRSCFAIGKVSSSTRKLPLPDSTKKVL